jgi:lipoprotein-anchoring transpeptidase ErfK/SrfK
VIPEGATFDAAKMPYWMRLTDTGVGMHVGHVPGRPASHGCIRLKREVAVELFSLTKIGTPVVVAESAPSLGR